MLSLHRTYGEVAPRGRTRRVHNHINIMDDGVVIGPPEVVFAAIERFAQRILDSLGLVMKDEAVGVCLLFDGV